MRIQRLIKPIFTALLCGSASLYGSMSQAANCTYTVNNEWNNGFTATISITNNGSSAINGWTIGWQYNSNVMTSSYNATVSGNNPYAASALSWNSNIGVGQTVSFGLQGTKANNSAAEKPTVTGAVCSGNSQPSSTPPSSTAPSSTPPSSKPLSSVAPSSIAPSSKPLSSVAPSSTPPSSTPKSSTAASGQQCNWYGSLIPLCATTASGWGYENNKSCVAVSTCQSQPSPYGVVGGASSTKPSSVPPSSVPRSSTPATPSSTTTPSSRSSSASSIAPIVSGCDGYATRYWDCCKPHCGWSANVPTGIAALKSCSTNNTLQSDLNLPSSCDGGNAHMCWGLAPFAVNDNLAYGYAATSNGDICGRCFQIQFTGAGHYGNDPGSAALAGKTMIVQATNIGGDVSGGQFDILIPGGGVGAFNACSSQWGVSTSELGAQYGGFLAACKDQLGYNASSTQYKSCVANKCDSVFKTRGLTDLYKGCMWFVDWFQAADNPNLKYKEVACPTDLTSRSGINRTGLNDIRTTCN